MIALKGWGVGNLNEGLPFSNFAFIRCSQDQLTLLNLRTKWWLERSKGEVWDNFISWHYKSFQLDQRFLSISITITPWYFHSHYACNLVNLIELGDANSIQFTRACSDICISKLIGLFIKLMECSTHKKKGKCIWPYKNLLGSLMKISN